MFLGIMAGFCAAFLQAISYLCSRFFILRHDNSSASLVIYSQLVMGGISLLTLPFVSLGSLFASPLTLWGWMAVWLVTITAGQFAFFAAIRQIEASKISSLLGLKIIVLAIIYVVILGGRLNFWQYLAIALSAGAALAMNWSGGARLPVRGLAWLGVALVTYCFADIAETHLVLLVNGPNHVSDGIAIATVCYGLLGLATLPALKFCKRDWRMLRDSVPFALAWLYSMTALFVCFAGLGTVFGNVVQASRGVISVGMGVILVFFGATQIESPASRQVWVRRLLAACLMALAIVIYSLASRGAAI